VEADAEGAELPGRRLIMWKGLLEKNDFFEKRFIL
jgi:hypothetical protein